MKRDADRIADGILADGRYAIRRLLSYDAAESAAKPEEVAAISGMSGILIGFLDEWSKIVAEKVRDGTYLRSPPEDSSS